jgi:hypothetical protein
MMARLEFSKCALVVGLLLFGGTITANAGIQTAAFRIPPVRIRLEVKDQEVTIVASAFVTVTRKTEGLNQVRLELLADFSDLQQNLTQVLSSELDKNDRCGDRIAVQNARLTPTEPASLAVVQLHYERWACAKVLGKEQSKRLTGGDATIPMRLTPAVERNNTELRLVPEVGPIEADGSLGELLRSGALGQMLQEKIHKAILSAMQKGTSLSATLPPAIQGYATIQDARFRDLGSGRLAVVLAGEFRMSDEQIQLLSKQVKELVGSP